MYIGEVYKGGRYTVLKKIGWGHFSTVWLVLDNDTNSFAAMKVKARQVLTMQLVARASVV